MTKKRIATLIVLLLSLHHSTQASLLTLTTWNMEWLSIEPNTRSQQDLRKITQYFAQLDTDILAFQEVNSIQAIKTIVGNEYKIYLSDRHRQKSYFNINQYTGFAVKKGITVTDKTDFSLSSKHHLRFASYLILNQEKHKPIHLLSIHLKAGCRSIKSHSQSCKVLKKEFDSIHQWIASRVSAQDLFIILGDFNYPLTESNSFLLSKQIKSETILATKKIKQTCMVKSKKKQQLFRYPTIIDHILVSKGITITSAEMHNFNPQDVLHFNLTDHCPISVKIN